jgi:LuxR family maltose regulon positive regulatory protein
LGEAADWLERLRRLAHDWEQVELLAMGERAAARLAVAEGNVDTAREVLRQAEVLLAREEFANNVRWVTETRIQVWLASGNLAEASAWAAQTRLSPRNWDPSRNWEVLLVAQVWLAQRQYAPAAELLESFREQLDQPADVEKALEWLALSVMALYHAGKRAQATSLAARLLALTEPQGYLRLYLDRGEPMRLALSALHQTVGNEARGQPPAEGNTGAAPPPSGTYVSRLLAAFEQEQWRAPRLAGVLPIDRPVRQTELTPAEGPMRSAEPLSRQELRVLRLLVAGHTYLEIAQALVVSPNTIKSQVGSIYRKLDVRSRLEAYSVAQRLHLL